MAKPPFQPTPAQRQALDLIVRLARRRARLAEETDSALLLARDLGIPYGAIADADGRDWETVKRHLTKITKEPAA